LSADHTIEELERAVRAISKIGDKLMLKYGPIPEVEAFSSSSYWTSLEALTHS